MNCVAEIEKMKKAYVEAYARQNLGDDMFILSLLRRYPEIRFYLRVSENYRRAFQNEANICFLREFENAETSRLRKRLIYGIEQITQRWFCNVCIRIGGSIFMESPNPRKNKGNVCPNWLRKYINKNKFVVGANFGPWFSDSHLQGAYRNLSQYRGVCFRDSFSYELFKDIARVHWAPDILFGGYSYPTEKRGNGVGISVVAMEKKILANQYATEYYDTLVQVCDLLIDADIPVKLFAFCVAEGDVDAIKTIMNRVKHPERIVACVYDGDVETVLNEMNNCEFIMATRFHAMIFAFVMSKTVLPIIYSEKQTNVIQDIGFQGRMWNVLRGEHLQAKEIVSMCFNNPTISGIDELICKSEKQFAQLDSFVNNIL